MIHTWSFVLVYFSLFVCNKLSTSLSLVENNGNAMLGILFIANTLIYKIFYWLLCDNNIKLKKVHNIFWMLCRLNVDYQKATCCIAKADLLFLKVIWNDFHSAKGYHIKKKKKVFLFCFLFELIWNIILHHRWQNML